MKYLLEVTLGLSFVWNGAIKNHLKNKHTLAHSLIYIYMRSITISKSSQTSFPDPTLPTLMSLISISILATEIAKMMTTKACHMITSLGFLDQESTFRALFEFLFQLEQDVYLAACAVFVRWAQALGAEVDVAGWAQEVFLLWGLFQQFCIAGRTVPGNLLYFPQPLHNSPIPVPDLLRQSPKPHPVYFQLFVTIFKRTSYIFKFGIDFIPDMFMIARLADLRMGGAEFWG